MISEQVQKGMLDLIFLLFATFGTDPIINKPNLSPLTQNGHSYHKMVISLPQNSNSLN